MSNEKRKIIAKAIAANNAASKAVVGANKVENVFSKASLLFNTVKAAKSVDTGLRSTISGGLYTEKSIFFKRPEVLKALSDVKNAVPILINAESDKS